VGIAHELQVKGEEDLLKVKIGLEKEIFDSHAFLLGETFRVESKCLDNKNDQISALKDLERSVREDIKSIETRVAYLKDPSDDISEIIGSGIVLEEQITAAVLDYVDRKMNFLGQALGKQRDNLLRQMEANKKQIVHEINQMNIRFEKELSVHSNWISDQIDSLKRSNKATDVNRTSVGANNPSLSHNKSHEDFPLAPQGINPSPTNQCDFLLRSISILALRLKVIFP
jgi:hypothetical protein